MSDSPSPARRIAVITLEGSRYGMAVLEALAARHIGVTLVVVVANPLGRKWRLLRSVARRIGWLDAARYAVEELLHPSGPSRPDGAASAHSYEELAQAVARVSSPRAPELPALLRSHAIDVVLLGQSGIVPAEVLAAPRVGTLNAHPGMLPAYRGMDCAAWALLHDDKDAVGSSLHWVDAGVDTGAIITRSRYAWRGDESMTLLNQRLSDDCVRLLADGAAALLHGDLPSEPNTGGTQYYKMPRRLRREVEARLAAGRRR